MKQSDIDWKSGRVVFWDLESVDHERPIVDQLSELKEDLAQVSFSGNLLIDVGWYPEFSEQGVFLVSVVKDENWDEPLLKEKASSVPALLSALRKAVGMAERRVAQT